MTSLGDRLRSGRKAKGWTLRETEEATRISNGYLSLIETGKVRAPAPRYLKTLADALGIDFTELMALAGHPSGPLAVSLVDESVSSGSHARATTGSAGIARSGDGGPQPIPPRSADLLHLGGDSFPTSEERVAIAQLVSEDMAGLTLDDIRQVRAFIAGLRAARR